MALEGSREALDDDIERIADLARTAIAELEPMRGGRVWRDREARPEPLEAGLRELLKLDTALVLAGTFDDVVVGYAVVRVEEMPSGDHLGVVDDIFVEDGARGVGVGEAMMDEMVAWCVARGCVGMDAMALPGARQTKNFFEELGFTARKLVLHHSLREKP